MEAKTERKQISTLKIAAVYIGTIVGAGFASGQEVLQFFSFFGLSGLLALAVSTFLFVFFGLIILELGRRLAADSHREVIQQAGGRWLGSVIDKVITFFLFGALTAMAAGAGAIFREQFGLPYLLGSFVMVAGTVLIVILGIHGVLNAISFVVPLLLVSVLGLSLATLLTRPLDLAAITQWADAGRAPVPFWPLSAIIYVSYNLVLGVSVLAPLGRLVEDPKAVQRGALYGGLGLGIGALAINAALLANVPVVTEYEIPMVYIAALFSPVVQAGYSIVLLAEVFTTAVGSLYGFAERLTDHGKPAFRLLVVGSGAAALAASQFGFANLVRTLYPAAGYAGLLMLGGLLLGYARERLVAQPALKRKK